MITVENVTMKYPNGTVALKDINLQIDKGEFVFIVGSTGSGKTTLLELLLRELVPTKGKINVAGFDCVRMKRRQIPKMRRKLGVVFQNFRLIKDRTVYENVAFAQRVIETPPRYIRRQVPAVLTMVGLADKYKSYPNQLSGGEQQRVAIARSLASNVDLIFADEPTGNLDTATEKEIISIFKELSHEFGKTIIVVTHSDTVSAMSDQRVLLKDGKLNQL